jgi:large subunit ribosomal protein L6
MSRIGKQPIPILPGVTVNVTGGSVAVRGPKGSLERPLPRGISAAVEGHELLITRADASKRQKALHGLTRALLARAVTGVHAGFSRKLEISGVGYAAEVKGGVVHLKLGYSHPVAFPIPPGIEIKVERNVVTVSGCDLQQVGQVAADIRALRPPDVYKHKGIKYQDETLRKKAGKTGAK